MPAISNFFSRFYFHALGKILGDPRNFFSQLPADSEFIKSLGFLIVSSLFFTGASVVSRMPPNPLYLGGIFFINAVGMVLISALLGYLVMVMFWGRSVAFKRLFCIYAFASGMTLLAAWIPFFIWFTEPWKWWLIGTGLGRSCGFGGRQIIIIIALSVGILTLLFGIALPPAPPTQ